MAEPLAGDGQDARAVALVQELGAQLGRLKGAGPTIVRFLSMVELGAVPDGPRETAFRDVRKVVEQDLDDKIGALFDDFGEQPFAVSSLGQVHRARTSDGEDVAVKVQHAGLAKAVEGDLRNLGVVGPLLGRIAPGLDAGAVLAEIRERISDQLDGEVEAQHQRRLERLFRGHPHVRVPRVHTELSTGRVLVTEYVEGVRGAEIARLGEAERDRVAEIAFRFCFGLVRRDGTVVGDPDPENCILCPDGRLCLVGFGLVRDLDAGYLDGERDVMRAIADGDAARVHDGMASLGYVPEPVDPDLLLEHLATAGEWMLTPGFRRLDSEYAAEILELGYPPRSPYFGLMRRLSVPPPTLLLRRMEVQLLELLGALNAGADWGAITAEFHSGEPASTALGREDRAFLDRRAR